MIRPIARWKLFKLTKYYTQAFNKKWNQIKKDIQQTNDFYFLNQKTSTTNKVEHVQKDFCQ